MKNTDNRTADKISPVEIPEYVYESLARGLLPVIQKYYESNDGKRAFAEWKEKRGTAAKDAT